MADGTFNAGDVVLEKIELHKLSGGKFVDIREQIVNINVYESILSPVLTAIVNLHDSVKLRENFPIIADRCKVKLYWSSPDRKKRGMRKLEFLVSGVTNSTITADGKANAYQLSLSSIEILSNSNRQVKRGFYSKTISDYVNTVMSEMISTSKQVFIQPTKGIQRVDSLMMKPFQAIDVFRQRAVSPRYESSLFVFFENKIGFMFCPIEHLLKSPAFKITDGLYFFDSDVQTNVKNTTYKNILAYTHVAQQATSRLVSEGALNNKTVAVDLRTGGVRTINHNSATTEFQGAPKSSSQILPDFEGKNNQNPAKLHNVIKSTTNPDNFLEEKSGKSKAFLEMMAQNILRILVYGDSYLSAGFVIDVHVPNPAGTSGEKENSNYVSGNMLISNIRHIIYKDSQKMDFQYHTAMELVNPFFGKA